MTINNENVFLPKSFKPWERMWRRIVEVQSGRSWSLRVDAFVSLEFWHCAHHAWPLRSTYKLLLKIIVLKTMWQISSYRIWPLPIAGSNNTQITTISIIEGKSGSRGTIFQSYQYLKKLVQKSLEVGQNFGLPVDPQCSYPGVNPE